jgi:hypothetical protein
MKRVLVLSTIVMAGLLLAKRGVAQEKSDGGGKEHENSGSLFGSMFGHSGNKGEVNKGAPNEGQHPFMGPHDEKQLHAVTGEDDKASRPAPSPSPSPSPAPPPPRPEAPTPHADHHGPRG